MIVNKNSEHGPDFDTVRVHRIKGRRKEELSKLRTMAGFCITLNIHTHPIRTQSRPFLACEIVKHLKVRVGVS